MKPARWTDDGGSTWTNLPSFPVGFGGAVFVTEDLVVVGQGGDGGGGAYSEDDGQTWTVTNVVAPQDPHCLSQVTTNGQAAFVSCQIGNEVVLLSWRAVHDRWQLRCWTSP